MEMRLILKVKSIKLVFCLYRFLERYFINDSLECNYLHKHYIL